jgi:hypothetical protein
MDWYVAMDVLCMRGLKREVALVGERAAGLMQARQACMKKEHEREVNCGCMMLMQTGVNGLEGRVSRVLS